MFNKILPPAKIHMIGIGGVSMSGLSEILLNKGYTLSGSDISKTETTLSLEKSGIKVFYNHDPKNIEGVALVVFTAAISKDNPEYLEALKQNIPTIERKALLGELAKTFVNTIAISGTHGKTTTTSLISLCFLNAGLDPTLTIGGTLPEINSNYKTGSNKYFITEACEYVESFLSLYPTCEVILNIDEDHLDYFKNLEHIISAFDKFTKNISPDGFLIINNDDKNSENINFAGKKITFGINSKSDFMAKNIKISEKFSTFDLIHNETFLTQVKLQIAGIHNIYNSLATIAVAMTYDIPLNIILDTLYSFQGAKRRFEFKGSKNNILVYDDYAHHPTEIKATLRAAKEKGFTNVYAIFQPHTYSRTKALLNEFANSFADVSKVIITDIYASREKDTGEISAKDLANKINEISGNAIYIKEFPDILEYINKNIKKNSFLFTIGAGNIYKIGEEFIASM